MNKYDWKNAFPKPSENFHNKLCMTLETNTLRSWK